MKRSLFISSAVHLEGSKWKATCSTGVQQVSQWIENSVLKIQYWCLKQTKNNLLKYVEKGERSLIHKGARVNAT